MHTHVLAECLFEIPTTPPSWLIWQWQYALLFQVSRYVVYSRNGLDTCDYICVQAADRVL